MLQRFLILSESQKERVLGAVMMHEGAAGAYL